MSDPRGVALQSGHDLYTGGTVSDDGDLAAGGFDAVNPASGVQNVAVE